MNVRVGDLYACLEPIMAIGRQEMAIETAEKVADFTDAYVKVLQSFDERRNELLAGEYADERRKMQVFDDFANETAELPEFSFKEFGGLRITPDGLSALKRAGLYAQALDG